MKNKFIFFLLYLFLSEIAFADQFIFETSKIEILNDGKKIKAEDGKVISQNQNLEIDDEVKPSRKQRSIKAKSKEDEERNNKSKASELELTENDNKIKDVNFLK